MVIYDQFSHLPPLQPPYNQGIQLHPDVFPIIATSWVPGAVTCNLLTSEEVNGGSQICTMPACLSLNNSNDSPSNHWGGDGCIMGHDDSLKTALFSNETLGITCVLKSKSTYR